MRILIVILIINLSTFCFAQSSYQFGILPALNLNKQLPADWKLNFKIESRQELKSGLFEVPSEFQYNYILSDFSLLAAKKIGINKSLAIGYLTRFRNNEIIHRSIQQFIISKSYAGLKLGHRFSTDQTYQKEKATKYRLRYRLTTRFSMNGQSVDPKEFYLKINNEYLNAWQGPDYDFEIRIVPHLGYLFSNKQKLELGLDYRLDSFLKSPSRNKFWIVINCYLAL